MFLKTKLAMTLIVLSRQKSFLRLFSFFGFQDFPVLAKAPTVLHTVPSVAVVWITPETFATSLKWNLVKAAILMFSSAAKAPLAAKETGIRLGGSKVGQVCEQEQGSDELHDCYWWLVDSMICEHW
jgi:hypothetical protein